MACIVGKWRGCLFPILFAWGNTIFVTYTIKNNFISNTVRIDELKLTKKKGWYGIISQFQATQWSTTILRVLDDEFFFQM
jgi:hypothetical protein